MVNDKQNRPGILIGILILTVYWGLLVAGFELGALEVSGGRQGKIFMVYAHIWIGLSLICATRLSHMSWFFRLWIDLSLMMRGVVRGPKLLAPIGLGILIASLFAAYRIW